MILTETMNFGQARQASTALKSGTFKFPESNVFSVPDAPSTEKTTTANKTEESKPMFAFKVENTAQRQRVNPKTTHSVGQRNATDCFSSTLGAVLMESPWREMDWTAEHRKTLMEKITSYKPSCQEVPQARVLLLGPVGSGKSSFISSVQSVFDGRVINRAMVGSSSTGFTKKSFPIRGQKGEEPSALVLCDVMGLGEGQTTGLTLHDTLAVVKGHAPEGHKFSPEQPVRSETAGYMKKPSLRDKMHCVVFVVDASKLTSYHKGLGITFQQLREHISDLGVHQVALLTHVDQVCQETARDVTQVYKSSAIQKLITEAAALLGMSPSYIVPVRNYSCELALEEGTDVLLLSAVDHILQYVQLYFQDHLAPETKFQSS
ncbi:interferon-induced protein 44 isoform 2-T2 [Polymixia lowei]